MTEGSATGATPALTDAVPPTFEPTAFPPSAVTAYDGGRSLLVKEPMRRSRFLSKLVLGWNLFVGEIRYLGSLMCWLHRHTGNVTVMLKIEERILINCIAQAFG
jgi:hypothetical protein